MRFCTFRLHPRELWLAAWSRRPAAPRPWLCCSCPRAPQKCPCLPPCAAGSPGEGKARVWVLARQHPGESMAEWFTEGLLRRLLDGADPTSRRLLCDAVFYVVSHSISRV